MERGAAPALRHRALTYAPVKSREGENRAGCVESVRSAGRVSAHELCKTRCPLASLRKGGVSDAYLNNGEHHPV